jgi:hypothetical protein
MLEIGRRSEEARAPASEGTAPQTTCEHRADALAGAQMHGTPAAKLNTCCGPGGLTFAQRGDVRTCAQQPEGRRCAPLRAAPGVKGRRGRQGGRGTARAEARRPSACGAQASAQHAAEQAELRVDLQPLHRGLRRSKLRRHTWRRRHAHTQLHHHQGKLAFAHRTGSKRR